VRLVPRSKFIARQAPHADVFGIEEGHARSHVWWEVLTSDGTRRVPAGTVCLLMPGSGAGYLHAAPCRFVPLAAPCVPTLPHSYQPVYIVDF
jgi:hypothetical protein